MGNGTFQKHFLYLRKEISDLKKLKTPTLTQFLISREMELSSARKIKNAHSEKILIFREMELSRPKKLYKTFLYS